MFTIITCIVYYFDYSKEEKTYPNDIPSIFLQWKLRRKVQVKGAFLKVAIGPRFAPSSATDNTPTEESDDGEKHDDDDDDANKPSKPFTGTLFKRRRRIKSKDDRMKLKNAALRRTRGPKDPCYVPDRFLYRLDVGPDGAMVVAFSNSGHLLAVASRAPRFNSILNTTGTNPFVLTTMVFRSNIVFYVCFQKLYIRYFCMIRIWTKRSGRKKLPIMQ